jgi:hypothetical protein
VLPAKKFERRWILACAVFILFGLSASADDKKDKDKPTLSGVWTLKGGETKLEFGKKKVLKISPHGDSELIAVICECTVEKEGMVKAKITDLAGKDEAKEMVKELLPPGTEFSFKWTVKDGVAKLHDLKGEKVEPLKSHLEGEYSQQK